MTTKNGLGESAPDYPWRDQSKEFGEENYDTEEESFKNIKETIDKPCIWIWEVFNSKVKVTEVKESGEYVSLKFYNNRAYIVLSMEGEDSIRPEGVRNLHIWVSKYCSRQDYQLAVARVDQLCAQLKNPKPTVHREIQLYETDAFHNHEWILEVRSSSEDSPVRLLQFHIEDTTHRLNKRSSFKESSKKSSSEDSSQRLRKQWMVERELLRGNLTTDDVFVLIFLSKSKLFQWNGRKSRMDEQEKAKKFLKIEQEKLKKQGHRTDLNIVSEGDGDKNHEMYGLFPHTGTKKKASASSEKKAKPESYKKFIKLTSDSNGEFMDKAEKDERNISKSNLPSKHVYLIDTDYQTFLWIGDEWKDMIEQNKGELPPLILFFEAADRYLINEYKKEEEEEDMFHLPVNKPITLVYEDDQCIPLDKALSGH